LFVEVLTDEGLVGVGEASQNRNDAGVVAEVERLKSLYVGRDPFDLIEERNLMLRRPDAHRLLFAAVSGLEQALWDICGKAVGLPVYKLLGGSVHQDIRLYANISLATTSRTPAEYASNAAKAAAEGFTAVKINAFDPVLVAGKRKSTFRDLADLAEARVKAVRSAIGDDIDLLTDWSFTVPPAEAGRLATKMAAFNLFWIEEPFITADPELLSKFRPIIAPRLATGEQLCGRMPFRRLLEARAADVLMPDVKWIGGLLEARKVAAMAEAFEVEIAPHNMSGPVATAASAHLCASSPNFLILEYCWGATPWREALVRGEESIRAGYLELPSAPGLGVNLDQDVVVKRTIEAL
jgi:galactonate dehydratase